MSDDSEILTRLRGISGYDSTSHEAEIIRSYCASLDVTNAQVARLRALLEEIVRLAPHETDTGDCCPWCRARVALAQEAIR